MGMGEPLLNLRNVLGAVRVLTGDVGIGARHITLSTVGVPNAIMKLATHKLQSTLAVSIHAPTQPLREQLVPRCACFHVPPELVADMNQGAVAGCELWLWRCMGEEESVAEIGFLWDCSAKVYPLEALMLDCHKYFEVTGRRITFEYALMSGVNDSVQQVRTTDGLVGLRAAVSEARGSN